jgi:two-component system LytT family sensor kinase
MKIDLPKYSSKDYLVLALVLLPITLIINSVIFGARYFGSAYSFLVPTVITAFTFCVDFIICGGVAVILKERFPKEKDTIKKLSFMILTFIVLTGLFLGLLFKGYESIDRLNYRFNQNGFVWAYLSMCIVNIFLTLVFEGIDRYDNWKASLKETDEIRKTFRQSQLQGLKSQLNPHFLFNSLNSLSSLICCDNDNEAEIFLDEMSKVYRYMLRNEEEQLVTLETELKFLDSYMHLLKARYCDGIDLQLDIDEADKQKLVPALTMQVIMENAFTLNCFSKSRPLKIRIASTADDTLYISNSVNPKQAPEVGNTIEEMDNLVNKYHLLNMPPVVIKEDARERVILLPLICKKEGVLV